MVTDSKSPGTPPNTAVENIESIQRLYFGNGKHKIVNKDKNNEDSYLEEKIRNLNHFMHFLPSDEFDLKDMFFVIHLLLAASKYSFLAGAAGIELELQKEAARELSIKKLEDDCDRESATLLTECQDNETQRSKVLSSIEDTSKVVKGTNLDLTHNYLALNNDLENAAKFILSPDSKDKFNVVLLQNDKSLSESNDKDDHDLTFVMKPDKNLNDAENELSKRIIDHDDDDDDHMSRVDKVHGAVIATGQIVTTAAEMVTYSKSPETPPNTAVENIESIQRLYFGNGKHKIMNKDKNNEDSYLEEKIQDLAVIQAIVDCPALLAMSENGVLDLSKWVQTYLFSTGLSRAAGEGCLVGQLKDWNWAEEMVPVQMIQALSEATNSYLCMERMYCPFYDTILLLFNNPTPYSLQAESSFVTKLKTLPGLQHFLEYVITEEEVMNFVMDTETRKGPLQTMSVETLMRLIPENQWILIPSIKYRLQWLEKERLLLLESAEEMEDENETENESSNLKDDRPKKLNLTRRQKYRKRKLIDLGDGEPWPPDDNDDTAKSEDEKDKSESESGKSKNKNENKKKGKSKSKSKSKGSDSDDKKSKDKKKRKSKKTDSETDESKSEKKYKKKRDKSKDKKKKGGLKKKGKKVKSETDEEESKEKEKSGKLKDEIETPLPVLTPETGSILELSQKPKFGFMSHPVQSTDSESLLGSQDKKFNVYDLGKKQYTVTSDDYHLFPLDGTIISYNVSTIEPDFHMMQLKICKNGHQSIFYPYYFPHEADLSQTPFVFCPFFHMVLANGTIVAFHDKRTQFGSKDSHLTKIVDGEGDQRNIFNLNSVRFFDEFTLATFQSKMRAHRLGEFEGEGGDEADKVPVSRIKEVASVPVVKKVELEPESVIIEPEEKSSKKKSSKEKKKKKKSKDGSERASSTEKKKKRNKKEKKEKKDKKKRSKKEKKSEGKSEEEEEENQLKEKETQEFLVTDTGPIGTMGPPIIPDESEKSEIKSKLSIGEWKYPSSDETDFEESSRMHKPSSTFISFGWDQAKILLAPLVHTFKITLPSGLMIQVNDVENVPLIREVKQTYLSKGCAFPYVESCRYYTMDGSVVKFLTDGTIQILNARGVTTNIREIAAHVPNGDTTENLRDKFEQAYVAKVFKGDVIQADGEFWHISNGNRVRHTPLFLFTSGTMPNGEIFRRRQDGTIYIHRNDGCFITHYPDGTRFTSRLVELSIPEPDFEDWEFIGLKYMIEHPNYAPVLFNTLSGNIHIRMPQGDWVRIFADGTFRFACTDEYKLDVTQLTATLSCPTLSTTNPDIPNLTIVKLYHMPQPKASNQFVESSIQNEDKKSSLSSLIPPSKTHKKADTKLNHSSSKVKRSRVSVAGSITKTLMKQNLRPEYSSIKSKENLSSEKNPKMTQSSFQIDDEVKINEQSRIRSEIQAFLEFTDSWTLCKAIDSFDNRFAMDIYGNTVIDKGKEFEDKSTCHSISQHLMDTSTSQIAKQHLTGILNMTPSEELTKHMKRMNVLKKVQHESCNSLPRTKMFIIKRDLSGYEFLKQSTVDRIGRKAKANPHAVMNEDPIPFKSPRKFLTIMEPIVDSENPHGIWKSTYREPVFRPRYMCNKHLKLARPEDIRWFAHILGRAHKMRGKYFSSPKEEYKIEKERQKNLKQEKFQQDMNKLKEVEFELQSGQEEEDEEEEQEEGEGEDSSEKRTKNKSKSKGKKGKGKKKKSSKDKSKRGRSKDKIKSTTTTKSEDRKEKEAKGKTKKGKSKSKKSSSVKSKSSKGSKKKKGKLEMPPAPVSVPAEDTQEEEEEQQNEGESVEMTDQMEIPITEKPKLELGKEYPGDYPENISDVQGLYGPEAKDETKEISVTPYQHTEILSPRKAIVVRTIVEIPKLDEKMQNLLLAASKSYAQIVEEQKKILSHHSVNDPRSEEEKEEERKVRRELIQQNIQDIIFLEQTSAKLLDAVL